jgi:alpha-beta hydrolase superfamily lysophospholipase
MGIRTVLTLLVAVLAVGACAPIARGPNPMPTAFAGPRLEAHDVVSFDGQRLGLMSWTPKDREPWAVVVGLHGMNDYSNAFHLAAPYWAKQGIATYAYDQRGFGRSDPRGIWVDEKVLTRDLRTVVSLVRARYPQALVAVVGESMGGAVTIEAFASDRPPDADRVILVSPAVWGWSSQPIPNKSALWLVGRVYGSAMINPPKFVTDHIEASDNVPELIAMGKDPLMEWGARADALYGLVDLMQHAWSDVGQIRVPVLDLHGDHDQIIPRKPALEAAAKLKSIDRSADYANGWHLLLVDTQAEKVWADIAAFIADPNAPLPSGAPPIPKR